MSDLNYFLCYNRMKGIVIYIRVIKFFMFITPARFCLLPLIRLMKLYALRKTLAVNFEAKNYLFIYIL